jgi:hypothetical protein
LITGGIDYGVTFQSDVCLPHPGQQFRAKVALKSKIGIHVDMPPLKVLLPRDLHIGNEAFEDTEEGDEVDFTVVGPPQFKQGDEYIIVVGRMAESTTPKFSPYPDRDTDIPELNLAGMSMSGSGGEVKKVVVQPQPSTRKLKKALTSE